MTFIMVIFVFLFKHLLIENKFEMYDVGNDIFIRPNIKQTDIIKIEKSSCH